MITSNALKKEKKYVAAVIIIVAVSATIRLLLFDYVSGDYAEFLSVWFDNLFNAGGIKGIGLNLGDYTCPYIYILALLTYIPVNSLYSIKAVSCFFDFVLAGVVYSIIAEITKDKLKSVVAFGVILLSPTVIRNSAMWAQCDSIFTTFIGCSFLYILKEKPWKATIFFGIAFSFKLQSIFFAPLFICLLIKKKIKIRHLLLIPVVYILFCIPAILAGREIFNVLTVYLNQSGEYKDITNNAPSVWEFFYALYLFSKVYAPSVWNVLDLDAIITFLTIFGIVLTGIFTLIMIAKIYKKEKVTTEQWKDLAYIFVLVIPFLLPRMHERYFYLSDIFSVIYAVTHKKRWFVPVLNIAASELSYIMFLHINIKILIFIAAHIMTVTVIYVVTMYFKDYYKKQSIKEALQLNQ